MYEQGDPHQELLGHSDEERLSIDEILSRYVGDFGLAQLLQFILANFALLLAAMHILVMVFAHQQPKWNCKNLSNSTSSDCSTSLSLCEVDPFSWEWAGDKHASVVSEWDLICHQSYKVGLAGSIFFVGGMLGSGVFGNLSDKFLGRKGALTVSCVILTISGLCTATAPTYWVYLVCRGFTGVGYGGIVLSCFVLSTEVIGASKRGVLGMCAFYFFSAGTLILPGLAYMFSSSWRQLFGAITALTALYCILVLPFLHESPRWYIVRGKGGKALQVLKSIAKRNGNQIPANVRVALESSGDRKVATGSILDLFRHRFLRNRLVVIMGIWFTTLLNFYTISFNVMNIDVSLFLSVPINGISEVPAYAISALVIGMFGRRKLLVSSLLFSGVSCTVGSLLSLTLDQDSKLVHIGQLLCGALGIFGGGAAYNLMYIYAVELFPTEVRNAALGLGNQSGQLGAILAPLVVLLSSLHPSLPLGLIGAFGIFFSVVALMLPETLNQPLQETIEDMSKIYSQ